MTWKRIAPWLSLVPLGLLTLWFFGGCIYALFIGDPDAWFGLGLFMMCAAVILAFWGAGKLSEREP